MKLTKKQIHKLRAANGRAVRAENKMDSATANLASVIIEITNGDGNVDFMAGDGFGFTPISNNDTHISIDDLIKLAENGIDITEDEILKHLSL